MEAVHTVHAFLVKWQYQVPPEKRSEFVEELRQASIASQVIFRNSQKAGRFTDGTGDAYLHGSVASTVEPVEPKPGDAYKEQLLAFLDEAIEKGMAKAKEVEMWPEIVQLRLSLEGYLPVSRPATLEEPEERGEMAIESNLTLTELLDHTFKEEERDVATVFPL